MNDIGSYSLWWILIQRDWYRYYADLDYLNEQKEYLSGLLKQVLSTLDKNGREHLGGGMRFLDWPSNENPDAIDAGLQSLTVMALQAGSELSRLLGDQELAQQCDLAQKKALKEAQKLGRSFLKNHDGSRKGDKQAAALLALCGAVPPQDVVEVLTHNGAANFSTFYGYYMLEALAMAGEYQQAMDLLGTYWGGMLELGATTFWEDFDLAWMENAARIDSLVPEGKTDVHGQYGAYCYVGFTACATAGLRDRRRGSPGTYWASTRQMRKHWSSNHIWAHWSGQRDPSPRPKEWYRSAMTKVRTAG